MALFDIRNLSVNFDTPDGRVEAVRNISLSIARGKCFGIVGESGSGKSQTFLAAMGLLSRNGCATGSIKLEGQEILGLAPERLNRIRGSEMTMIFQDPLTALTPQLRVGDQLAEVVQTHSARRGAEIRQYCLEWLDRVRMPDAARRMTQFPHELSGGQRQRVMIAMAMLLSPRLLIADEPTTALDVTVQADILDLIAELQTSEGMAVALITHDMGVVARMCDRIKVMRNGTFVESGTADAIFTRPRHDYTRTLLEAMPRLDRSRPRTRPSAESRTLLRAEDIDVRFKIRVQGGLFGRTVDLRAVDGVSLDVAEGETLGLVGESGCGKSTLARAILQLVSPWGGRISWLGHELTELKAHALKKHRKDLQIIFQDPLASLDPRMTVSASIGEPLRTHMPELSSFERNRLVSKMMERVGLSRQLTNRFPHELSGGQNQRVGIARAMITSPRLVVCDEAVSSLDVSVQAQILALLKDLRTEYGLSMIFISHDLSVVREIADRIMVLYLGRVVELADCDALFEDPRHPYTRTLISAVPVPDPKIERSRRRIRLAGELPSALDPVARLRFLRTRVKAGETDYIPRFEEVAPGHFVAEHDLLDDRTSSIS
ncbi:MAG: ABC transporter ATP-binding protein [Paracoccaceae bacterium]|nr:ABC transporter ATP-binding protein [Paracoccaceae bacterium]